MSLSNERQWHFYINYNKFWNGDHLLTSFQLTCLHSYFTFLLIRPQNNHVNTSAARKKNINTEVWKMRVRTFRSQCRAWQNRRHFHSTVCKGRQRVLICWLAYHHQSVSSVVEWKRALSKHGRNAVVHRQKCRWMASSSGVRATFVRLLSFARCRHFIFQSRFK